MAPKQQAKGGKNAGKNAKQTGKKQDLLKKPKKSEQNN